MRRSTKSRSKDRFPREKSGRSIVIFDWRDTGDLRREYALVYRAGLLDKTGCPVGGRLRDKLHDFAHFAHRGRKLGGNVPPMTASVSDDANIVPRASHNDMQARKMGNRNRGELSRVLIRHPANRKTPGELRRHAETTLLVPKP